MLFHSAQAKLCCRMRSCAAGHSRMDSQANTPARSGIVAPVGYKIEALAYRERLPLASRLRDPILILNKFQRG